MNAIAPQTLHLSSENATLYSSGSCPELASLFDSSACPFSSEIGKRVIGTSKMMASTLKDHLCTKIFSGTVTSADQNVYSLAFGLATLDIGYSGFQNRFEAYGYDNSRSITSTIADTASWFFTPITYSVSSLSSLIFSSESPVDCSSGASLNREEYALCEGFKSYLAEKEISQLPNNCPTIFSDPNFTPSYELSTFGSYWQQAHQEGAEIMFNANQARQYWDGVIKPRFCKTNPEKAECANELNLPMPASYSEWQASFNKLFNHRLPKYIALELNPQLVEKKDTNDEL